MILRYTPIEDKDIQICCSTPKEVNHNAHLDETFGQKFQTFEDFKVWRENSQQHYIWVAKLKESMYEDEETEVEHYNCPFLKASFQMLK